MSSATTQGVFRRRVEVVTREVAHGGLARCAIEDDFHHFRVALQAADGVITGVTTAALRSPNTLCEAAGGQLHKLIGMALAPASSAVLDQTDQFQQCTHQFDLAGLGVAALALKRPRRVYEVTIPDRIEGFTVATIAVDGEPMLRWDVADMTIEAPLPYAGRSLGAGFTRFTRSLDRDEAEAALVMRRALFVSRGRAVDFTTLGNRGPVGGCWAWQPERMETLRRLPENRRDFSVDAAAVMADDNAWLAFQG